MHTAVVVARGFLATGGIDHFGAPIPSSPLRSKGLKVGPLNPARGCGEALFEGLE